LLLAVDTNIVVRLIVGDDPAQLAAARALLDEHQFFVPLTVLLETEWVLRSRYLYSRGSVVQALKGFSLLEGVALQHGKLSEWAIERHGEGADFADVVHLVASGEAEALATFDDGVAKGAGAKPPLPILTLG
jgi:predicted nucleic-acid-binding protein